MAVHRSGLTTWEDSLGDFGVERAKWQYVEGVIEIDEFERRVWQAMHPESIRHDAPAALLEANLERLSQKLER